MECDLILHKYIYSKIWKHGRSNVNLDAGYMDDWDSSLKHENHGLEFY